MCSSDRCYSTPSLFRPAPRLEHNATRAEGVTLPYFAPQSDIFLGGYGTSPAAGNVGPGHSFWGDLAPNVWILSISDFYPELGVHYNSMTGRKLQV